MAMLTNTAALEQRQTVTQQTPQPGMKIVQPPQLPSRLEAAQFVDTLFDFLFPMNHQPRCRKLWS